MTSVSMPRLCLAGFVATFVVTIALYPAFVFGIPKLDFATLYGTWLMRKTSEPLSAVWWIGMLEHFFNGAVLLPLLYVTVVSKFLYGGRFARGLTWGIGIWLAVQWFSMPLMGLGFFSSRAPEPGLYRLASWFVYLSYGVLFGLFVGAPAEEESLLEGEAPSSAPLEPTRRAA